MGQGWNSMADAAAFRLWCKYTVKLGFVLLGSAWAFLCSGLCWPWPAWSGLQGSRFSCSHSLGVQHPVPAVHAETCYEILLQTKGLAPYLTHPVQTHWSASGTSLIILEMWGWSYCNSCRVSFINSFLKSIIETETRLGKFRGNLNMSLSTRLFPKVSAGSLGRNGTSFLLSKHRPVVCCCYPRQCMEKLAVQGFQGMQKTRFPGGALHHL